MKRAIAVVALCVAACGEEAAEFTDCRMGELTGTWRVSYVERDGDCGPITEANVVLTPGEVPADCVLHSATVSDDKCEMTVDVECPFGGGGTIREVAFAAQVGQDETSGSSTITARDPSIGASCRSTYDTAMRRLRP